MSSTHRRTRSPAVRVTPAFRIDVDIPDKLASIESQHARSILPLLPLNLFNSGDAATEQQYETVISAYDRELDDALSEDPELRAEVEQIERYVPLLGTLVEVAHSCSIIDVFHSLLPILAQLQKYEPKLHHGTGAVLSEVSASYWRTLRKHSEQVWEIITAVGFGAEPLARILRDGEVALADKRLYDTAIRLLSRVHNRYLKLFRSSRKRHQKLFGGANEPAPRAAPASAMLPEWDAPLDQKYQWLTPPASLSEIGTWFTPTLHWKAVKKLLKGHALRRHTSKQRWTCQLDALDPALRQIMRNRGNRTGY